MSPHCTDVNRVFVFRVERVFRNQNAAAVHIQTHLNQRRHKDFVLIDVVSDPRFVSLEIPKGRPNFFHGFDNFFVGFDIRHARIKSRAGEIRQIFGVRRTADENALTAEFGFPFVDNFRFQSFVKLSVLNFGAKFFQFLTTNARIVNEIQIVHQIVNFIVEAVLAHKLVIPVKRHGEAIRHDDIRILGVYHFA